MATRRPDEHRPLTSPRRRLDQPVSIVSPARDAAQRAIDEHVSSSIGTGAGISTSSSISRSSSITTRAAPACASRRARRAPSRAGPFPMRTNPSTTPCGRPPTCTARSGPVQAIDHTLGVANRDRPRCGGTRRMRRARSVRDRAGPRRGRCRARRSRRRASRRACAWIGPSISHSRSRPTGTRSPISPVSASSGSSSRTPNASSPYVQCSSGVSHKSSAQSPSARTSESLARQRHLVVAHDDRARRGREHEVRPEPRASAGSGSTRAGRVSPTPSHVAASRCQASDHHGAVRRARAQLRRPGVGRHGIGG